MQRRKSRKPKADELAVVDGEHLYRVVVERVLSKDMLLLAESQEVAEDKAYALASGNRSDLPWIEDRMQVRDCTSVKLVDGTWEFCNALREE